MNRRRFLLSAVTVGAGGLAGCSDGGGANDDSADGGNDDSADGGNDDSADGNNSSTDSTGEPGDDGSDDGTDDEASNDTDDGSDDGTDGGSGSGTRLRDVAAFETQYVMEFESADGNGTWTFHEGDWYLEGEFDGEATEMYRIQTESGADTYMISDGECFRTSVDLEQDDIFDPREPDEDDEEYTSTERTTIDGEEVYTFEIEDGTYYVSVSSGYPVRFENDDGDVVTFHSWGSTDPIQPPDRECQDLNSGGN
ncbi:MAG: hypothetical protein ACOCY1_00585 [Halovenus sp.]